MFIACNEHVTDHLVDKHTFSIATETILNCTNTNKLFARSHWI